VLHSKPSFERCVPGWGLLYQQAFKSQENRRTPICRSNSLYFKSLGFPPNRMGLYTRTTESRKTRTYVNNLTFNPLGTYVNNLTFDPLRVHCTLGQEERWSGLVEALVIKRVFEVPDWSFRLRNANRCQFLQKLPIRIINRNHQPMTSPRSLDGNQSRESSHSRES